MRKHDELALNRLRRRLGYVARTFSKSAGLAEEVIAHLSGLVGAEVRVTLEIEAEIPTGAPERVVRRWLRMGNPEVREPSA